MAQGRILKKKICFDHRVAKLSLIGQLVYERIIMNLDREGRMDGEPDLVKGICVPLIKKASLKEVAEQLDLMHSLKKNGHGLITLYKIDGVQYICCEGFESEQPRLQKEREAPSHIPRPSFKVEKEEKPTFKPEPLDEKLASISKVYEEEIGLLTPQLYDSLKLISEEYPDHWFKAAVDEAVKNNKRNLKYVEAILKRWKADGKGESKKRDKPKTSEEITVVR